ncbi:MAG: LL-diaminopimelate aminotransferase [Eubacteriales bacterium]|nr:LL-diaminopimelate aminotransferase [Eubacteriales bacterium]
MKFAARIENLSPAIFAELDQVKTEVKKQGKKVYDLGIGSPDLTPAPHIRRAIQEALQEPGIFSYPSSRGAAELREAIAEWYRTRFGVELDPEKEVLVLMGSQDGLTHLAWAVIDPGDMALVPDPCYPIYRTGVTLAGGQVWPLPLKAENEFLPRLEDVPPEVLQQAKLMILNYPNNPVAAVASEEFFARVVEVASRYDILVVHDFAYSELVFDGYRPPSFLSLPGAKEVGVEIHSLSKTFNMAGCRVGFMVGRADVVEALTKLKTNIDYGVFLAIQKGAVAALRGPRTAVEENVRTYQRRRDLFLSVLKKYSWEIKPPRATMFIWAPLPVKARDSTRFALELLTETGVVVVPGVAFGQEGEGYVRIALVQEEKELEEAAELLGAFYRRWGDV